MIQFRNQLLILLSVLLFSAPVSCRSGTDELIKNPYASIAVELLKNKIIMLADFQHSSMLPHSMLIKTLYAVNKSVQHNDETNECLTLILESSQTEVDMMNKFISEGDLGPWLNHFALSHSLEDIYLLEKLKILKEEFTKNKCTLTIKGFENYYTPEIFYTRTQYEQERWFVKERDSILFERARDYIENHSKERIIFYYGGAHLIKDYIRKGVTSLTEEESYGYYLANYLKRYFGKDRILTYNHNCIPGQLLADTDLTEHKDDIFMVRGSNSTLQKVSEYNKYYDWIIVRHENTRIPTSMRYVMSKVMLDQCRKGWLSYDEWNRKYNKNFVNRSALDAVQYITGIYFKSVNDFGNWLDTTSAFSFDRISTDKFSKYLFTIASYDPKKNTQFRRMLVTIGFGPGLFDPNYIPSVDEWDTQLWPAVSKHVKYFNAVGMLWFGTIEEKAFAKTYLSNETGLRYYYPSEYLELWYSRFYQYTFDYTS